MNKKLEITNETAFRKPYEREEDKQRYPLKLSIRGNIVEELRNTITVSKGSGLGSGFVETLLEIGFIMLSENPRSIADRSKRIASVFCEAFEYDPRVLNIVSNNLEQLSYYIRVILAEAQIVMQREGAKREKMEGKKIEREKIVENE